MAGKKQLQDYNFKDPFVAGQLVGMLVTLTHIEEDGANDTMICRMKDLAATQLQEYFDKPSEDILLMIKDMIGTTT